MRLSRFTPVGLVSFSDFLDAQGLKHVFRESEGAHTWMVWRRYWNEFAPLLFQ